MILDGEVNDIEFSNVKGKISPETIGALGQAGSQIASGILQGRQLTEVEQKCGKRPAFKGKKRNEWNDCVKQFAQTSTIPTSTVTTITDTPPPKKPVPTWVWVVSGVAVLGVIGLIIYKTTKK
jgi:hypothetical protein